MVLVISILIMFSWLLLGMGSFIYWWIKEFDFTTEELVICFFVGLLGPFSFIVGALTHTWSDKKVLIKSKRK